MVFGVSEFPGQHHAKKLQKVVAAEAQARLAEDALKSKEQQKQVLKITRFWLRAD